MNKKIVMPFNKSLTLLLFSVSVTVAVDAEAEDEYSAISELDFLSDIPVITSATRLDQKITNAPASITLLSREEIRASGAVEVPQLLKLVPGYLSYYIYGNEFAVTNRGYTVEFPGDLEIMIDGRPIYEPVFSAVEWSSIGITPDDIDHIEVVRGSNSPAYGSNAFLGAINIVTIKPTQSDGTSVSALVGDWDTSHAWARHTGQLGEVDYRFGVTYRNNSGFPSLGNATGQDIWRQIEDSNEAINFTLSGIYTPNLDDTLDFTLGGGKSDINIPDDDPLSSDKGGFNPRHYTNNYQLIRWTRSLGFEDQFSLKATHSRLTITEIRELGLLSDLLSALSGAEFTPEMVPLIFPGNEDEFITTGLNGDISERYDLEFEQRMRVDSNQRLVWGAGVRHDLMRSPYVFGTEDTVSGTSYRLFGNWEYALNSQAQINLGVMGEHNDIVGTFLSPRINLNYEFLPMQVLRLGLTRSNRTPSVLEANQFQAIRFSSGDIIEADVMASEDLTKSRLKEYEIGYLGEYFHGKLATDLRVFRTEIDGMIHEYRTPYVHPIDDYISVISNEMDWTTHGADLQLKLRLTDSSLISLQYAYTDLHGEGLRQSEPYDTEQVDDNLPMHVYSLLLSQQFEQGIEASMVWYGQTEVKWRQGDRIPQNDRLDLRLAKSFSRNGLEAVRVELIAQNVLNDFQEYHDYNIFDTRVLAKLSVNF